MVGDPNGPALGNLIGLWQFLTGQENDDTGLDDGIAQDGTFIDGADAMGGHLILEGGSERFDVTTTPAEDAPFDLSDGRIDTVFTQLDNSVGIAQSVVSRGEYWDSATEGYFGIEVSRDGAVQLTHISNGVSIHESTPNGFAPVGDSIRVTYDWSETDGGQFLVKNITQNTVYDASTPAGVNLDIGDDDGQSFTFGARENVDESVTQDPNFIKFFDGKIDYVAVYDMSTPPAGSDGLVTNDDDPALIDVHYDGDPDGDFIDNNDSIFPPVGSNNDVVFANGGNDTVFSGEGKDIVYGGSGDDQIDTENTAVPAAPDIGFPGVPGVAPIAADPDPFDERDTVFGETGNDTIFTGDDADVIYGGEGDDEIDGGIDDDIIDGGEGGDTIIGGAGNDSVTGGDGADDINTSDPTLPPLPDLGFPAYQGLPEVPVDPVPYNDLDTVDGGLGNDTIFTGDDADLITGGAGDDSIDAGIDADTIDGGAGSDTIIGGEGSDSIDGGADNDTIYGGLGPGLDATNIRDDLPPPLTDPRPDNGRDTIHGGDGDDVIYGQDDDDVLTGGAGDDLLDGGIDEDSMFGGDDRDTFVNVNQNDTVDGGEGFSSGDPADDFDTLDLRGAAENTNAGGSLNFILDDDNPENGTVFFQDADGNETGTLRFTNIERVIPCFTPGTKIATPQGERLVEELSVGDKIITRDNGIQEIRWLGKRTLLRAEMMKARHMQPILIRQGALGNGLPERDMMVSPNHRVLVSNDKTALYFDESEVLVAAKHLTGLPGVDVAEVATITYIHFMFDQHEVVLSDGAWSESFQPGDHSLAGIGNAQRQEIFELFPELSTATGLRRYQAARRALKRHEAFLLVS